MRKFLGLIILITAGFIIFGLGVFQPQKKEDVILRASSGDYVEKQAALWKENRAQFEADLIPICDPDYEPSCFLHGALTRLNSTGYTKKAAVTVLIELTESIIKINNADLTKRALKSLTSITPADTEQSRDIRLAVMRLQFSLGDTEAGLQTLESFKEEKEVFDFEKIPPSIAIRSLIDRGAVKVANKVAFAAKDWTLQIGPPPAHCFGSQSKADIIFTLIRANLDEGNFDLILPLNQLAIDSKSFFYEQRLPANLNYHLYDYYRNTPEAPKNPRKLCEWSAAEAQTTSLYAKPIYLMALMGCEERFDLARAIEQELPDMSRDVPPNANLFHDIVEIIMGNGNSLIAESMEIEDPRKRFERLNTLIVRFHENYETELETAAFEKAKELYNLTNAGIDKEGMDWTGTWTHMLNATGRNQEFIKNNEILLYQAKRTKNGSAIAALADRLPKSHPDYEWVAKSADAYWKKRNTEKSIVKTSDQYLLRYKIWHIKSLISEGKLSEAGELFDTIDSDNHENIYRYLFYSLLTAPIKDELFKKAWEIKTTDCIKATLVRFETSDPNIIVPLCIGYNVLEPELSLLPAFR